MNNLIGISGKIGVGKNTVMCIIQWLTTSKQERENWENNVEAFIEHHLQYGTVFKNSNGWRFDSKRFADKLKDMVCLLLGCTREQLEDREFKEKELGKEWWYYKVKDLIHQKPLLKSYNDHPFNRLHRDWLEVELVKPTPRLLLQLIGTECGRNIIHPNVWVNSLFSTYNCSCGHTLSYEELSHVDFETCKPPNWVITDLRFPNELKAIKDRDGLTIRVNRDLPCGDVKFEGTQEEWKELVKRNKKNNTRYNHSSETALDDAEFDYTISNNGTIEELVEKVKEVLTKEKII